MNKKKFNEFKACFDEYVRSFYSDDGFIQQNVLLKEDHSRRVCENATLIARSEGLDNNDYYLAKSIALFHDIGRFEQIYKYRTFKDSESEDHGILGLNVLKKEKVLSSLPETEQEIFKFAVLNHNKFKIKNVSDKKSLFHARLIRDADKLDIYRVLTDYHETKEDSPNPALYMGLDDTPGYSPELVKEIFNNRVASKKYVRTCNDMDLARLTWLFDMHFTESFRILRKRNYINKLITTLPSNEEIKNIHDHLNLYIDSVLKNNDSVRSNDQVY